MVDFRFEIVPAPLATSRKRGHSDDELPLRLKKQKVTHSHLRSANVLQPRNANVGPSVDYKCLAASTALKGKSSRMAPKEAVWTEGNGAEWNSQARLHQRFEERCTGRRALMAKRLSLPDMSAPALVLVRPRALSAPPEATEHSKASHAAILESPAFLRAQLMQNLRSRLDGASKGEGSLRMRKWVLWNSWNRRPADVVLPREPEIVCIAPQDTQRSTSEDSLLKLQRHLLGDTRQYVRAAESPVVQRPAISRPARMKRSRSAPDRATIAALSTNATKRPSTRRANSSACKTLQADDGPRTTTYALRSVACQA